MLHKFLPIAAATMLAAASINAVTIETALGEAINVSEQALNRVSAKGPVASEASIDMFFCYSSNPEHDFMRLIDKNESTTLSFEAGDALYIQMPWCSTLGTFSIGMKSPKALPCDYTVQLAEQDWRIIATAYPDKNGTYKHDPSYDNQGIIVTFNEPCEISEICINNAWEGILVSPEFADQFTEFDIDPLYCLLDNAKETLDNMASGYEEMLETYKNLVAAFQPVVDAAYAAGYGTFFPATEIDSPESGLIAMAFDEPEDNFEALFIQNAVEVTRRCLTAAAGKVMAQGMASIEPMFSYSSNPSVQIFSLYDGNEQTVAHIKAGEQITFVLCWREYLDKFDFHFEGTQVPTNYLVQLATEDGKAFRNVYPDYYGLYRHDSSLENQAIKVTFYEDCDLAEFYPCHRIEEFQVYDPFHYSFTDTQILQIKDALKITEDILADPNATEEQRLGSAHMLRIAGEELSNFCVEIGLGESYRYMSEERPQIQGDEIMLMSLGDEERGTAGISEVSTAGTIKAYDLSGRQVNPTRPGIYIINGKKVRI